MKTISILDFEDVYIGNAEDLIGGTGCTVVCCPKGMCAGLDVRGGGPASRESELLKPMAAASAIHAVLLGGGSAFGLDAAGGVMRFLEERGIGLDVGVTRVPLVCQSDIFDLAVADVRARPDAAMGYQCCKHAWQKHYRDGSVGVGTGATVGKMFGMSRCMKSGVGSYAVQMGDLKIGALVVVNAVGDIFNWKTGQKIAGSLNDTLTDLAAPQYMISEATAYPTNTTLGIVLTNATFDKTALSKIAGMTHNGYARAIRPVHTSKDGDTIYALSVGQVQADQDLVGTIAADVMAEAICQAIDHAESRYGYVSRQDLKKDR